MEPQLTTNEVVALFELDERRVRKEVEHGVLGPSSPPRFDLTDIVYLLIVAQIGFENTVVEDRKRLYAKVIRAITGKEPTLSLSSITEIKLHDTVCGVSERMRRFGAWKNKLVTDDRILAGEPVFPGTRLAVRQIGGMMQRGAPAVEIREDYPYLTDEDLEFARMFARAYPPLGRPRERKTPAG
jgi:uncharacterized protein (DUF433 family)